MSKVEEFCTLSTLYNPLPEQISVPLCPAPWSLVDLVRAGTARWGIRNREQHSVAHVETAVATVLGGNCSVLLVSSGTAALTLALQALRWSSDDEVIVCSFNCPSVVHAVLRAGMQPVFCDVGNNFTLDVASVAPLISRKTRAVIMTHVLGQAAPAHALEKLCREAEISLIDDAAQAFGISSAQRALGTWGDFGVLSFGRHKPLYAGGGGAVVSSEGAALDKVKRHLSGHPAIRSPRPLVRLLTDRLERVSSRVRRSATRFSDVVEALEASCESRVMIGLVDGLTAQLVASELLLLEHYKTKAAALANRYRTGLRGLRRLSLTPVHHDGVCNFLTFMCQPELRYPLGAHLAANGIESTWLYYPLHLLSRFRHHARSELPLCETLWRRTLCLPCRGWHSEVQVDRVIDAIHGFDRGIWKSARHQRVDRERSDDGC